MLYEMENHVSEIENINEVRDISIRHKIIYDNGAGMIQYETKPAELAYPLLSVAKNRYWALYRIDRFLRYIIPNADDSYLALMREIRNKTEALTVKKKDLNSLKSKMP